MILKQQKSKIEGDDFDGFDAGVDTKNFGKMFAVTSKNMYRRPVQSIVREITSNCVDSHIEAKVDDAIVIEIDEDEGGEYISFKDVGVGISPERMRNTYANWLSTTKDQTNDQIGMWGLGSKSPLAYTDIFYLTTVYDGIKYEYAVREGVERPRIDFYSQEQTEERNGTLVKIYIKNLQDRLNFLTACRSELLYFDNVFIRSRYSVFFNEYTIYDYKTFKYRPDTSYQNSLHIVLGRVAYPINWEELQIPRIELPFALKFEIGELQVTPERESIRYVTLDLPEGPISTKDVILAKIQEFKQEIEEIYYKDGKEIMFEDFQEFSFFSQLKKPTLKLLGTNFDLTTLGVAPIKATFEPLKNFVGKIPSNPFHAYVIKKAFYRNIKPRSKSQVVTYKDLYETLCILVDDPDIELSRTELEWLHEYAETLTRSSTFYFVYTFKAVTQADVKSMLLDRLRYYELRNLKVDAVITENTNKTKQLKMINDFIKGEVNRLMFPLKHLKPTPEWLAAKKAAARANRAQKADDEIIVYDYGVATVSNGKKYLKVKNIQTYKGIIIYGFEQDEPLIRCFRQMFLSSKYSYDRGTSINSDYVTLLKIAQRSEKYFVGSPNVYYIYDFMGDNEIFKKFATAAFVTKESKAMNLSGYPGHQNHNPMNFREFIDTVFPPVAEALRSLQKLCNDYGDPVSHTGADMQEFIESVREVALKYNLYDKETIDTHQRLEKYADNLDLINFIVINNGSFYHVVDFLKLQQKPIAKQWNGLEPFEKELLAESLEKADYLLDVYKEENGFKGAGRYMRSGNYSYAVMTESAAKATVNMIVKTVKQYELLLGYLKYKHLI